VTMTVHASLRGGTTVTWDEKAPPPADKKDVAQKLQNAFRTMVEGFMTALRPNLTNTFLPAIPLSEVTITSTGYALTEKDFQGRVSDLTLDKSFQVTHVSTHGPSTSVEADLKFIKSPKGFLLTEMDSATKKLDGSVGHSVKKTSYAVVDGYEVPGSLEVDTGSTQVHIALTGCKVER